MSRAKGIVVLIGGGAGLNYAATPNLRHSLSFSQRNVCTLSFPQRRNGEKCFPASFSPPGCWAWFGSLSLSVQARALNQTFYPPPKKKALAHIDRFGWEKWVLGVGW